MSSGQNAAGAVANALAIAGISDIFAYPGDPIIEFLEQARVAGLNVVLARREGTAAFMAEAAGMLTGKPGVCASTLGPGSTAMLNGVAAATLDRAPMIALSGQIDTAREQYFTHQVVDHKLLYSPVTKWAARLEAPALDVLMRRALSVATSPRPGAVHITLPADVAKQDVKDWSFNAPPMGSQSVMAPKGTQRGGPSLAKLLAAASRPVLLAGVGAADSSVATSLTGAAEVLGAPVIVSPMAKGVIHEDHEMFAGVLDMACSEVVWEFLDRADLIIAVGFDAVELIKPWRCKAPVVHIDSLPNTDQIYASSCEFVGHIPSLLEALSECFNGEPRWAVSELKSHRSRLRDAYYGGRTSGALNPSDVVDIVRSSVPDDAIATTDVGSHKLLVGQGWRTTEPRSLLMSNGLSSMGFSVPAAIATKIEAPDRSVVALVGDGGFAMTATELRLAAGMHLPLLVVVFVDGSLNRIELKQMTEGYPSTATRLESMDLVKLADAMGCDGVRVDSASGLENALRSMGSQEVPLIVEAHIDPSQYESQF